MGLFMSKYLQKRATAICPQAGTKIKLTVTTVDSEAQRLNDHLTEAPQATHMSRERRQRAAA
jgi:hypothetical protein